VPDRTQNVLVPLPCPLCGGDPIIREPESRVLQSIAEIVCSRSGHAAAAYGKTVQEALAIWNTRPFPVGPSTGALPRESLEIYRIAWNDNRGPLPQATKLTGERLDKLRRRIKEGLTFDDFRRAAWTCSHTEFLLRGTPKQEFHATFDWLLSNSGIVAKVLDGTYGPTGKTEAELLAEKEEENKRVAEETEKLHRHLAEHMRQGGVVPVQFQTALFLWELRQAERPDEVYAAWVECQARGMALAGPVAFRLKEWVTARVPQVTTDATATSG
jgi:hypothetical protein